VSGKIEDEEERQRLKQILKACKLPESVGLIVRTVAEEVPSKLWPFRKNLPGEVEH
jgi:Ribonuclease G/E